MRKFVFQARNLAQKKKKQTKNQFRKTHQRINPFLFLSCCCSIRTFLFSSVKWLTVSKMAEKNPLLSRILNIKHSLQALSDICFNFIISNQESPSSIYFSISRSKISVSIGHLSFVLLFFQLKLLGISSQN